MQRTSVMLFAAPLLLLSACAATGGFAGMETTAAKALISDDQEKGLGLQVKQELDTKQHVIYLDDPTIVTYVRDLADKVLVSAKKERGGMDWQVNVIDDPKTVNAFATPGGYLYVYTGLLLLTDNEAQLAGIMGHECGHVVARHSARQMIDQYGLEAVAALALGSNPGLAGQLGSAVVEKGTMLSRSRADEDEADEYGARYANAAGYDPHALAAFFEKLKAKMGDTSGITTWLSDHPASLDRIQHVNDYSKQNNLTATNLAAERFVPIRQRLQSHKTPDAPTKQSPQSGASPSAPPGNPPPNNAPPN